MKNALLVKVQALLDKVDEGYSEAVVVAQLRSLMAKDARTAMKQSENSNLPTEVRMGCSKKGYTRQQHASCTAGSQH